jgi:hypothetical protein
VSDPSGSKYLCPIRKLDAWASHFEWAFAAPHRVLHPVLKQSVPAVMGRLRLSTGGHQRHHDDVASAVPMISPSRNCHTMQLVTSTSCVGDPRSGVDFGQPSGLLHTPGASTRLISLTQSLSPSPGMYSSTGTEYTLSK